MRERATTREFVAKWQVELLTLAVAIFLAAITRFETDAMPLPTLDRSWEAAIAMVLRGSSNFGGDVVFTYGPLGFIQNPTFFFHGSGALAIWLNFAERVVLAFLLVWLIRERLGWPFALVLTYAIMTTLWVCAPAIMIVATIAAICRPSERRMTALALGGGALAAYCLLEKANSGVLAGAVLVVGLAFMDGRWRLLGMAAASWLGALVVIWLLAGQTLTDIPGYLASAVEQASAYSGAMLSAPPTESRLFFAAAALLAVGFAGIWFTGRNDGRDVRVPLAVLWVLTWFLLFKQGFVRQGDDEVHTLFMFSVSACFIAVLPWSLSQRWPATAAALVGVAASALASPLALSEIFDPPGRLGSAATAVRLTFDGPELTRRQDEAAAKIIAAATLPREYAQALRSAPSTPWPSELSVAWATGADYRPLPSLQAYAGFTEGLDKRNADKLRSGGAPQFVLMRDEAEPDGRLLTFDAPTASREMVCRYRPVEPGRRDWLLLRKGADRCTRPARRIKTVTAPWGGSVRVPAPSGPDSFVYVTIEGTEIKGLERLRDIVYRPYERRLFLDGTQFRLAPGTAPAGAIISAGARADLPEPFAFALNPREMAVDRNGNPTGKLRFTFYEQQVGR